MRVCSFDEINQPDVKEAVNFSFRQIMSRLRPKYRSIIRETHKDFGIRLTPEEIAILLAALLSKLDPVTGYKFTTELNRKRDRLTEGILARGTKQEIRRTVKDALPHLLLQSGQYMDIATDDSRTDAMRRNGVEYVEWITQEDDRVCKVCNERNHKIYPIDQIPDKPHYRCRCYWVPVGNDKPSEKT